MKIKDFIIENLHGIFTFKSTADDKVNILVGNNGSFKTSLISILNEILHSKYLNGKYAVDNATINIVNPESFIRYRKIKATLDEFKEKAKKDESIFKIVDDIKKSLKNVQNNDSLVIGVEQYGYSKNNVGCSQEEFEKNLNVDYISTFDINGKNGDEKSSLLDEQLNHLQSEYSFYLSDLAKQMTDTISSEGSISKEKLDEINHLKNLMINFVNEAFEKTGKRLDPNQGKLTFKFQNGHIIYSDALSAGEKQFLIIMLTVLLEREREFIVFLDEPEISLHIEWQYRLIDMLTRLTPNAQFFLTTHSPSIFADGWGEKIIYMEDITKSNENG